MIQDRAHITAEEYRAECFKLCEQATVLFRVLHPGSEVAWIASEMTGFAMRCAEMAWQRLEAGPTAERGRAMDMFQSVFTERVAAAREGEGLKVLFDKPALIS